MFCRIKKRKEKSTSSDGEVLFPVSVISCFAVFFAQLVGYVVLLAARQFRWQIQCRTDHLVQKLGFVVLLFVRLFWIVG